MTKRKAAGGYLVSSDEEEETPAPAPAKKPKQYVPIRLSAMAFKPPTSSRSQIQSIQPKSAPIAPPASAPPRASVPAITPGQKVSTLSTLRTSIPTPRETPGATEATEQRAQWDKEDCKASGDSGPESPVVDIRVKGKERAPNAEAGPSTLVTEPSDRPLLPLEREVDSLSTQIGACMSVGDENTRDIRGLKEDIKQVGRQISEMNRKFDQLIEAQTSQRGWNTHAPAVLAPPIPAPVQLALAPAAAIPGQPNVLVEPLAANPTGALPRGPTPESIETPGKGFDARVDVARHVAISSAVVLAELAAAYSPRKKGERPSIPVENRFKKHLRDSFYGSLDDVSQANEIKVPYFDSQGRHLLFPPEFADPDTQWTPAYPDWDGPLDRQAELLVRVLTRIRSTAPKSNDDFSLTARTIREDLLVELVISGPWTSCLTEWRKLKKKTPVELDQLRQKNSRYKRRVTKIGPRAQARNELPELAGDEYNALYHEGFMSEEHSDPDDPGVFHVIRTDFRSSFVNMVYDASDRRTKEKRKAGPKNAYRRRRRIIKEVPAPDDKLPDLQRNGKVVPIALCLVSKKWRNRNQLFIKENAHRFIDNIKRAPNIDHFLAKYPCEDSDEDETDVSLAPQPERARADVADDDRAENEADDESGEVDGPVEGEQEVGGGSDEEEEEGVGAEDEAPVDNTANVWLDPALREETGTANPAVQSKPRPKLVKPSQVAAAAVESEPVPVSTIRIKIPTPTQTIQPLPQPHPDHATHLQAQQAAQSIVEPTTQPTDAVAVVPEQMPPGGPQSPPPVPAVAAPSHEETQPAEKPKRKRRTKLQIAADNAAAAAAAAAATAGGGEGSGSMPQAKRGPGRPRKDKPKAQP